MSQFLRSVGSDKRISRTLVIAFGLLGAGVACFGQIPSAPEFTSALPAEVQNRFPTILVESGTAAMTVGLQSFLMPAAGMHVLVGRAQMPVNFGTLNFHHGFPGTVIQPPTTGTLPMPFPGTVIQPPTIGSLPIPFPGTVIQSPVTGTLPFPGTIIHHPNHGHHAIPFPITGTLPLPGTAIPLSFPGTVVQPPNTGTTVLPFPGTVINPDANHGKGPNKDGV